MNTCLDCVPCFLRQSLEAARGITEDVHVHQRIVRGVLRMTAELDLDRPPPFVGQAIHWRLRELTGVKELGPDLIVPCHCTGDAAVERLGKTFGERVVLGAAGAVFRFGGALASTTKKQT